MIQSGAKRKETTYKKKCYLKGSRIGKYWKYDEEELNNFVRMIRGYDLESEESIRFYAPHILACKKSA